MTLKLSLVTEYKQRRIWKQTPFFALLHTKGVTSAFVNIIVGSVISGEVIIVKLDEYLF